MYGWIWRRLPGPLPVRLLAALVLLAAALAVLFWVMFPWVEPRLPWNRSTVSALAVLLPGGLPHPS